MLPTKLPELISSVVNEKPSPARIGEFVSLCRKIALVHLRRKASAGKLNTEFFRIPIDDLALDCVADLFQQDDNGSLVQVSAYFDSISYQNLSEEELLAYLRRLIFAKVNQAIFRMYNELDPSLGKILRNMKLAFQTLQNFSIVDRFGEQWVVPTACETLEHLPIIDRDELERKIRQFFHGNERIPRLLAKLGSCLREQSENSRLVPLMTVAFVLRSVYTGDNDISQEDQNIEQQLYIEDTAKIINQTCRKLLKENTRQYVKKKEIPREIFVKYFDVIELNLQQRIIGQDGELFSFYESLRSLLPELTKEEYAKSHKSRLEYLARLTYEEAVKELKKHM